MIHIHNIHITYHIYILNETLESRETKQNRIPNTREAKAKRRNTWKVGTYAGKKN